MVFVVLDKFDRLRPAGAGKAEQHVDSLKDGGVAAMTDGFDVDLDLLKPDASIARPTLHQEHPTRANAGEERLRRRDLLTGPAQVRQLGDDEMVVACLDECA